VVHLGRGTRERLHRWMHSRTHSGVSASLGGSIQGPGTLQACGGQCEGVHAVGCTQKGSWEAVR
jgi:hypothetical protein